MKIRSNYNLFHRVFAVMLAVVVVMGCLPIVAIADDPTLSDVITTVADPGTLTRPETIYGNDTENAGKVTVGKSVATSDEEVVLDGHTFQAAEDNFTITISQSAQVMGLLSEENVPVDVVFVLDTFGSMAATDANGKNRTEYMVEAVNDTIAHLMELNPDNRVGVVAFSAHNQGPNEDTDNGATTVLSPLASYSGNAATEHLTWDTVDNTVLDSGAVILNTYVPAEARVALTAQKWLEGRELTNEEFTFHVIDESGEVVSIGKNDETGAIVFPTFSITAEDMRGEVSETFTYTVAEVKGDAIGMIYDKTVYTIAVTVTDDQNGQLHAVVALPSTLVFHNRYEPLGTTLTLEATKMLTGRDLVAEEFRFAVLNTNGEEVASGTNTANGSITFEPISFDVVEVATFTIVEVQGEDPRFAMTKRNLPLPSPSLMSMAGSSQRPSTAMVVRCSTIPM